jgi:aldose 1-epimerase
MPVIRKEFGRLGDGRSVGSFELRDPRSGFSVELIEYGATIRSIKVPVAGGRMIETVLSYPALADYESGNVYLGATIGRCAGRTATGNGTTLPLTRNEASNHLHGGTIGFSHSLWRTIAVDDGDLPCLRLQHRSPAGEDGYPGDVSIEAEFALVAPYTLRVILVARSDSDTPLNLTLHPYFNLDGDATDTVDGHRLRIDAARILPLGASQLPTGETMSVEGTPFDFRAPRTIGASRYAGHSQLLASGGYDHYFVLREGAQIAADVYSPVSSLGMRLSTNQKGIQFYSGNQLDGAKPVAFPARSAFCLEPHAFPNAINEPGFPDITVRAGDIYRHETTYAFYRSST